MRPVNVINSPHRLSRPLNPGIDHPRIPAMKLWKADKRNVFFVTGTSKSRRQPLGRDSHKLLVVVFPQLCDGLVIAFANAIQQIDKLAGIFG